jgi:hypothetical protein
MTDTISFPKLTILVGPNDDIKGSLVQTLGETQPDLGFEALHDTTDDIIQYMMRRDDPFLDKSRGDLEADLISFLRSFYGPSALGRISLARMIEADAFVDIDHILIVDCDDSMDVLPFKDHLKPDELLLVLTEGPPGPVIPAGTRIIVLSQPDDTTESLAQLRRELSPVRTQ